MGSSNMNISGNIHFTGNIALAGGAIFVKDPTTIVYCATDVGAACVTARKLFLSDR